MTTRSPAPPDGGSKDHFRDPADTVTQNWAGIAGHLRRLGHELEVAPQPRQFASGFGNLNYLVRIDGAPWVLRRPPMGPIPPGANHMAREHTMLKALSPVIDLVPRPLHFCDDASVLGAPFLIMAYRPGLVIGGALPAGLDSRSAGPQLSAMMVAQLARLHAVAPASVGLGDFGKPAGFLERAVAGWIKRGDLALGGGPRPVAMAEAGAWLQAHLPAGGDVTLLHNDFKLDNIILDPETLAPRAIVDWDMGSRGDPLFDLATLLSYWTEAGDPPCLHRLNQMPTAAPGFWSRREVVDAYARATGRDVTGFGFYRVLTAFKLAVVFLQLEARVRSGGPVDPKIRAMAGIGMELMDYAGGLARRGGEL